MDVDDTLVQVGHGDPGLNCGHDRVMVCHDCGEYFRALSQCYLKTCPDCFGAWAHQRGRDSSARAWSWSLTMSLTRIKWEYFEGRDTPATVPYRTPGLYHVIVSFRPRPGPLTLEDVRGYRRRAYQVFKAHGLIGGVAVFHAGRKQDRYLTNGPHVHAVALAVNIAPGGMDEDESSGDIVFKVIPFRGDDGQIHTWRLRQQREARNVLSYLLTHTITGRGLHSLTYFGGLAYNRFPQQIVEDHINKGWVEGGESPEWCRCPFCGSDNVSSYIGTDWTDPFRPMSFFHGPGPPEGAELPLVTRAFASNRS